MKAITINHDGAKPAYQQIADELRSLVARGLLAPGEALPSVRRLGRQLGVNLNTVAKAYRVLSDEGLVEIRHGSAARVRGGAPAKTADAGSLDESAKQALHRLIDRWVLMGTDRRAVERLLATAVDEYFQAARAANGGGPR